MIARLLAKLMGTANDRELKKLRPLVAKINALEKEIQELTDSSLALKTNEFRQQLSQGRSLDDLLPEAFAVVRETARRKLNMRHYDVQLVGGIVLHKGIIAEMKTGEGKALAATLPLYLNALGDSSSHLVTVNDYLASRDANWMRPVYEFLGMNVGILQNNSTDQQRKDAYSSDIMYATNNELGFDYLRDNMKFRFSDYVQKDLNYAIVDEVDSILIDEARTPLIISGAAEKSSDLYLKANSIARQLQPEKDYEIDEKARSIQLTEEGVDKIESSFGVKNLYDVANIDRLHHITQAVKAYGLFRRDVDYVVNENSVQIVDEFTGRILSGRRYSDGLHQALEAKEGVDIASESHTLASITLQNFFRLYKKLAGMTGTALTESEEFHQIYKLKVISIPTNKPIARQDKSDLIFLTQQAKYKAIAEDVKERHKKGQPVLIGTVAIETSEIISQVLTSQGIAHDVLNAKQHMREAEIVEHAGKPGKVTIATNMAGRGTDIKLSQESLDAGGLYILGTERHESRRIDNQLRGRSGRQGDPGESRFYISLEDNLIRIFAGDTLKNRMKLFGMEDDEVIESSFVSKRIESSQEKVEKHNFEIRKHLIEYDDVLNQQRKVVYRFRYATLESEKGIYKIVRDLIITVVQDVIKRVCPQRVIKKEQFEKVLVVLSKIMNVEISNLHAESFSSSNSEVLQKDCIDYLLKQYDLYRNKHDEENIHEAEKWLILEVIDQAWKQHMVNLDHLKEGIGLRGWGQKNPLIEYKRESFAMFQEMMDEVRLDIVSHIFKLNATKMNTKELESRRERELQDMQLNSSDSDSRATQQRTVDKVGRNDDCPCGSGKKYKKCCM